MHSRSKPARGKRSPSKVQIQDRDFPEISQNAQCLESSSSTIPNEGYSQHSIGVHDTYRADQVDLIIRSYVPDEELHPSRNLFSEPRPRICGSWVEALPDLIASTGDDVVLAATNALAASILSRRPVDGTAGDDGATSYLKAIQIMRKQLGMANNHLDRELLASIMCLSLAEVGPAIII